MATVSTEVLAVDFDNADLMLPVFAGIAGTWGGSAGGLRHLRFTQQWDRAANRDVWLWLSPDEKHVLRIVIADIAEDDAHFVRSLWLKAGSRAWEGGSDREHLKSIVEDMAAHTAKARADHAYRNNFFAALRDLSNQFAYVNGGAVEAEGTFTRCGLHLKSEDVDLLRQVWERLPLKLQLRRTTPIPIPIDPPASCPVCRSESGAQPAKRLSHKTRPDLLKRLAEHSKAYPQAAFDAWAAARLAPGGPTLSTTLFDDYAQWVHDYGDNREARRESRATALTQNKWGRLMVARFARATRSAGGKRYAVRLLPA